MRFIDKLERKFGRYAIPSLVTKLAYIYSAVYIAMFVFVFVAPEVYIGIIKFMAFDIDLVLRGQIWRIITFIFIPSFRPDIITTLFLFFIIRFMMYIGNTLEYHWGTFKLNLYYLIGIVSVLVISSITGTPIYDSGQLHLSIFLACAFIAGDTTLNLYGILPVKMKYLAYLDFLFIAYAVLTQPLGGKLLALAPLVPYFIFFWKDIYYLLANKKRTISHKKQYQYKAYHEGYEKPKVLHSCEVCGVTDVSDPNMDFRYCSKCEGLHEYCINHINNHEHVKN